MIPFNVLASSGNRLNNLIPDPNCTLLGYWPDGYSTTTVSNNLITNIGDGETSPSPYVKSTLNLITGITYFVFARARVRNSECTSLVLHVPGAVEGQTSTAKMENPKEDAWYDLYGFQTPVSDVRYVVQHVYFSIAEQAGKVMEIEGSPDRAGGVWAIKMTGTKYENYTELQMLALVKKHMQPERFDNILENGLFKNGQDQWNLQNCTAEINEDIVEITATDVNALFRQTPDCLVGGHKYYGCCELSGVSGTVALLLMANGGTWSGLSETLSVLDGEFHHTSLIKSFTTEQVIGTTGLICAPTVSNGSVCRARKIRLVDLTERYGTGNEPSVEYCDLFIAPYINYDPYTVLLLHGDENYPSGNPSAIGDSSEYAHTVTSYGVETSDVQAKFGRSLRFEGLDKYLNIPDSNLFNFGTGDFTISLFAYFTTSLRTDGIIGQRGLDGNNLSFLFFKHSGLGNIRFRFSPTGLATDTVDVPGSSVIPSNEWVHLEVSRAGSNILLFVNGTLDGTGSVGSTTIFDSDEPVYIGVLAYDAFLSGYLDDIKITSGKALHTSNFTPPTAPHPNMR